MSTGDQQQAPEAKPGEIAVKTEPAAAAEEQPAQQQAQPAQQQAQQQQADSKVSPGCKQTKFYFFFFLPPFPVQ